MKLLVTLQTLSLNLERDPVRMFRAGLVNALSCLVHMICLTVVYYISFKFNTPLGEIRSEGAFMGAQIVVAGFGTVTGCSFQRRPAVFWEGTKVDGLYTVSAISRYSFAWVGELLQTAKSQSSLEYCDLPALEHATRSENLQKQFTDVINHAKPGQPLWYLIYRKHKHAIWWQSFLTIIESIALYGPQACLYIILKLLEHRKTTSQTNLVIWVILLSVTMLFYRAVHTW